MKKIGSIGLLITAFNLWANVEETTTSTKTRFENLELFNKVVHLVETQYYRPVDNTKLIEGAIKGMLATLDPHSGFLNKEVFSKMQSDTSGEFGGLGLEVAEKDGMIYVITAVEDTPAFKAGMKSRDKIIEIDGESIIGSDMGETVEKMRGKPGTKVTLGIVREGEKGPKTITLVRELIQVKPVKYSLVNEDYAYVKLTQFQRRSAESMVEALQKLSDNGKKKFKGIILDLRNNPGGLLDQAVDVSSIFLKDGIVVSTEARDPQNKDIRYVKKTGYKDVETPLAVLINGSSASASEIVAGALQDHKRAIILGSQSFGKGSVQSVAQIDQVNGLKLTIAQYMTPLNRKIQAIGIKPDVEIDEAAPNGKEDKGGRNYVRERDLRNHLTATIETEEEKEERLKLEKQERQQRAKEIGENKKKKEGQEDETEIFTKYDPQKDYQVQQSIKYLQTFNFYQGLKAK